MAEQKISADADIYYVDDLDVPEDFLSETSSLSSRIYNGVMENGRRYQTIREDKYWSPSDDKQFESLEALHLTHMVMDSQESNPLFRAPIGDSPKHILDLGTGKGTWAVDVADLYPDTVIRGVDLFPPPVSWMPPNCLFEIDDVLEEWTWREPFDFIHMRMMLGAFTPDEWTQVYQNCYQNLAPGGWIEQIENHPEILCDDGSLSEDNILNTWASNTMAAAEKSGRSVNTMNTMRAAIEEAGFVDIHEKTYKVPIGAWAKDPVLKEAGRLNYHQWSSGLEGWGMWVLTKYGEPHCWAKEEVQVYAAEMRAQLRKPQHHTYHYGRRIWARKPMPGEKAGKNTDEKTDENADKTDERTEKAEKTENPEKTGEKA